MYKSARLRAPAGPFYSKEERAMKSGSVWLDARITPEVFREFAFFDTFRRQKRWKGPALFALIMGGFAGVCFALRGSREQAALIGAVLLLVGLGLPAAYVLSFFLSVRRREKALKAAGNPVAYQLRLEEDGLRVRQGEQEERYPWEQTALACRLKRCLCVYVEPRRAFLLPPRDGEEEERLWAFLTARLPGKTEN